MRDEGYSTGSVLLSFLLGGVVGAGLALLFAPQSGKETRQKIKDMSDEALDKTNDYVKQAREKATSLVEDGKGFYEEKKSILMSAVEAGKDAYEKEKEKYAKG